MKDRRKGPDKLVRILIILTILGWVLLLAASVIVFYAKPEMSTGFLRYRNIETRDTWINALLIPAFISFLLATTVTFASAYLQRRRGKRQTDLPIFIYIVMLLLSAGGLLGIGFLL